MDDFSIPGRKNDFGLSPSPANFIKPGRRPLSSMCPNIILNQDGECVFVSGSAGGSKITTTVAYVSSTLSIMITALLLLYSPNDRINDITLFILSYRIGFHTAFLAK